MALVLPASGLAKMNIDDMVGRVADRLDVASTLQRLMTPESGWLDPRPRTRPGPPG